MSYRAQTGAMGPATLIAARATTAAGGAEAAPLPAAVAEMIEAAANDPEALQTVAKIAKKANPDAVREIDVRVAQARARAEARQRREAADRGFLRGWEGKGEAGINVSTGNTDQQG